MCVARGEARAGRRAARAPGRTRRARLQAQTVRRRLDAAAIGAEAPVDVDRVDALDRPRRHGFFRNGAPSPKCTNWGSLPATGDVLDFRGFRAARRAPRSVFSGRARAAVHGLQPRNCWEADSAWSRREQTREGDAVRRLVHASESLERLATRRRLGLQQLMLQHCLCPSQARVVAAGAASRCSVHSRAVARHHGRDAASRSCVFFLARRMPGRALVGSWWITIKSIDACSIWKPHSNRCNCLWQPLHAAHLVRAHDLRRGAVLFGEENSHAEA